MILEMRWAILLIAIMNFLDYVFSMRAFELYGVDIEANPLMRFLVTYSPISFFVYKCIFITIFLLFFGFYAKNFTAFVGTALLFVVYFYVTLLHVSWIVIFYGGLL